MSSFFEKLKKGMGIEEAPEEVIKEPPKESNLPTEQAKKKRVEAKTPQEVKEVDPKELKIEKPEIKKEKIEISQPLPPEEALIKEKKKEEKAELKKEKWPKPEGELAVDVYQAETDLVIQAAIAGVKPEFLDISLERDIITIKGTREKPFEENYYPPSSPRSGERVPVDYFTQECYWGPFSREVILPVEIDPDRTEATMKEGILTIRIPKILREKGRRIKVKI